MAAPMETDYVDKGAPEEGHGYDFDCIVVGGGSGGLAFAQEAAKYAKKKIAVLDFVKPSPQGTSWGLGGTCVNVGCIPKKLMHYAAVIGEVHLKDSKHYGWQLDAHSVQHDWMKMKEAVQDHIGSLNWGYRTALRDKGVEYINALATFIDPHTIECVTKAKKVSRLTARRFLVAVGGRPKLPPIPGIEYCITSDDLFSMDNPPGKTLVIGASYVALECAGFLAGFRYDVTVMARSIVLRGFDQQMAEAIREYMESHGTKFIRPAVPTKIEKEGEKLKATWKDATTGQEASDVFDTVLVAVGRQADTAKLGLEKAGVNYDSTGDFKIPVVNERTNVPHIYALGDCIKGPWELTPVAIKAGRFLARRLYLNSAVTLEYAKIPTTVFTPLEYGCIGLSEETANQQFGEENIEVYHAYFKPLEWTVAEREDNACYLKLVINKSDQNRVVGFHYTGPNAGEVTQGYAVAIKMGARKEDFDNTVGIHPTCSEEFVQMNITKRSGEDAKKTGC